MHGQTDKYTDRQTNTHTDRRTHGQTDKHTDRQTNTRTDSQTHRQTDEHTDRQTKTQTDRRTHRQTHGQTDTRPPIHGKNFSASFDTFHFTTFASFTPFVKDTNISFILFTESSCPRG